MPRPGNYSRVGYTLGFTERNRVIEVRQQRPLQFHRGCEWPQQRICGFDRFAKGERSVRISQQHAYDFLGLNRPRETLVQKLLNRSTAHDGIMTGQEEIDIQGSKHLDRGPVRDYIGIRRRRGLAAGSIELTPAKYRITYQRIALRWVVQADVPRRMTRNRNDVEQSSSRNECARRLAEKDPSARRPHPPPEHVEYVLLVAQTVWHETIVPFPR